MRIFHVPLAGPKASVRRFVVTGSLFSLLVLGTIGSAFAQAIGPNPGTMAGGMANGAGSNGTTNTALPGQPMLRNAGALDVNPSVARSGGNSDVVRPTPNLSTLPPMPELPPNDFQKFVQQSIGKPLPLYGVEFFQNAQLAMAGNNPFAPIQNTPVSPDYPLGPGDEVLIRGWGSVDVDVRAVIDRNGLISIPKVGTVQLAGVKSSQAEGVIHAAIGRYFRDFELNVTFGQLRAITVYVVGQARRPGTYNLSSMSTLVSGLFASGGPAANGSMRRVQLKRGGKVIAELDLYKFLAQGNNADDTRLADGDVIFIPPAYGYAALTGEVNNPAVYELKSEGESLGSLLSLAGGLPVNADARKVYLERINPDQNQPREVQDFALNSAGLQKGLHRGDLLTVMSVNGEFANAVTLRGNVSQPVRMPWTQGMRIRDLIPSKEMLVSKESVLRQNSVLLNPKESSASLAGRIGNLIDEVNLDYAVIERVDKAKLAVQLIPFNLGHVLADANDPDNKQLLPGDVVTVFSVNDVRVPLASRRVYVRVEGEVQNPGVYQMAQGDNLQTLVDKAGGLTRDAYLFGTEFYRDEVRVTQAENLDKLIRRLETDSSSRLAQIAQSPGAGDPTNASQQLRLQVAQQAQRDSLNRLRSLKPTGRISLDMPIDMRNIVSQLPPLRLQNGDRLVVPARPDFIHVVGSVNTESALIYRSGRSVQDYLDQSGLSIGADRDALILVRADGSALTSSSHWTNTVLTAQVMPGDTLIVPEKIDQETYWSAFIRNAKDITQIVYQLGLGAAAYKALGY